MGIWPTKQAAGGRIQSDNDDFHQFINTGGRVVYWVDSDGAAYGEDYITKTGTSILSLKSQFDSFVSTGLPSVIDTGTF